MLHVLVIGFFLVLPQGVLAAASSESEKPAENKGKEDKAKEDKDPGVISAGDYGRLCDDVMKRLEQRNKRAENKQGASSEPTDEEPIDNQLLSYCQAATLNREAISTNKVLGTYWMASSAICCAPCLAAMAPIGEQACMGATGFSFVQQIMKGEGFEDMAQSLMGPAGMMLMGGGLQTGGKMVPTRWIDPATGKPGVDAATGKPLYEAKPTTGGANGTSGTSANNAKPTTDASQAQQTRQNTRSQMSCSFMLMGAMNALQKNQAMKQNEEQLVQNLALAAKVKSEGDAARAVQQAAPQQLAGAQVAGRVSSVGGASPTGGSAASAEPSATGSDCNKGANGNLEAARSCALAADKNLPDFVGRPNLGDVLKKSTGLNLSDLLKAGPTDASGMANALGGGGNAALSSALAKLEAKAKADSGRELASSGAPASYKSGGGGGGGGGAAEAPAPDFAALMQGLLNQGAATPDQQGPLSPVEVAAVTKGPSALAEDSSISIFDRVSYRYTFVGRRVLGLPPPRTAGLQMNQLRAGTR